MQYTRVEFRCNKCNKKLAETEQVFTASVGAKAPNADAKGTAIKLSIKCPRCGLINRY